MNVQSIEYIQRPVGEQYAMLDSLGIPKNRQFDAVKLVANATVRGHAERDSGLCGIVGPEEVPRSGWAGEQARSRLLSVLRRRIRLGLPTVVIGQLSPEELRDVYGNSDCGKSILGILLLEE